MCVLASIGCRKLQAPNKWLACASWRRVKNSYVGLHRL